MNFSKKTANVRALLMLTGLAVLVVSCAEPKASNINATEPESPNSSIPNSSSNPPEQSITLSRNDLSNVDKLLLRKKQANQSSQELALGLLDSAKKLASSDEQQGLDGGRSGLAKSFCGSAIEYPTIEALAGCAESIALEDASFDVKVDRFQEASDVYRATLEFSKETSTPISEPERQAIEENMQCLDTFVKSPSPDSPECELVKNSLKK